MKVTSITTQDLTLMVNLIDACAERGAFKGAELISVGQLREKLVASVTADQTQATVDKTEAE